MRALVLGSARTLEQDRTEALRLFKPDLIVACNHAARDHAGRVDHWATMHPELLPHWVEQRRAAGRPDVGCLWAPRHRMAKADVGGLAINLTDSWGGSSGLLCVTVALEHGASHVVLAGVPMRKTDCHYDDPKHWLEARQYWPAWERSLDLMGGRVRSLSGWTAELLGLPTREWLDGDAGAH